MNAYDNISDYILQNFAKEDIRTLANNGASGGVSGLVYYSETSKLYDMFKVEIWAMIEDDIFPSDTTPLQYIANLNGGENVLDDMTLKNLLVWYAFEICSALTLDTLELNDE